MIANNKKNIVVADEVEICIEINKDTMVYEADKYILIIPLNGSGYRHKLVVPISCFKNEIEKREFIKKIQLKQ
ncbi:hypothetical protein [Clostridium gasigenes]|uniref:Uncharacterized protein n=1 Tax=Clostridium gasigenes TaxID=94869 RepID=A0A7X0SDX2_9CLOT|nr:hypothetical protein [Clostridium gasigenes]MBB6715720.1 hypothetical protein [Clostridium gasigenes]